MKRIITLLVFIITSTIYAQNSGITYQAVIYNPSSEILPGNNNPNVVLAAKDICLRFSFIDSNSSLEYQEIQKVKTDEFGMVNIIVGDGDQVSGYAADFDAVIWNSTNKNLKVEIDAIGNCNNFIEITNQKFASVPFAFASKVAENVSGIVPIINGGTGAATAAGARTNLGLNNVDNTSDLNKPVSTATQTALDVKATLASPGFTGIPTAPTAAAGTNTTQIATTAFVNAALATTASPDATATQKGRIQLAGDLGGTADTPTVPGLANKENAANKSTDTSLGNSDILFPTQKAVKTYVDNLVSSGVADATTTDKGKIQLAGDLAGVSSSSATPIISNDAISTVKIADAAVTTSKISDANVTETKLAANAVTSAKIEDGTIASIDLATNSITTDKIADASVTETKVATNSVSTAKIIDGAVTTSKIADNAVTNAKLGEIVVLAKGGTGSNMTTTAGYVKQATTGANFTTVSSIPVTDVTGAVRKVNGVQPDTDGNVAVIIGRVFTGAELNPNDAPSISGATPGKQQSDIYIVASANNINNGRTFIYDGTNWLEVATDLSATDARYVNVAGDSMEGNLTVPNGKDLIIVDAPLNATDAANKEYVDTKIGGSGTTNFVTKFSAAKTLTDSSIFDDGTKVGIGTVSPANTLEIKQGTTGNSGLRFTNLTSSNNATTASNKVLGVNNNGDVILTNIPGTQNIVAFSTATPTTSGVVFTPNTPSDQSVIYQSSTDNSLWTYNGTTYVTYTPPATTAWNLAGTSNDAGGNKITAIERTGSASITNGFLRAIGNGNAFTVDPTEGTGPRLKLGTTGAPNSYFELGAYNSINNFDTKARDFNIFSTAAANMLYLSHATGRIGMNTTAPVGRLIIDDKSYIGSLPLTGPNLMDNSTYRPHTRFQNTVGANNNGLSIYSTTAAWAMQSHNYTTGALLPLIFQPAGGNVGVGITTPSARFHANTPSGTNNVARFTTEGTGTNWANIGLGNNSGVWSSIASGDSKFQIRNFTNNTSILHADLVSGNVGVGTATPDTRFHVNSASPATNTVNTEGVFRMMRPRADAVKWENIAQFNLGSYAATTGNTFATSRLDLAMNDGDGVATNNVMTWQANGNVGIGTTTPTAQFEIATNNGLSALIRRGGTAFQSPANLILQKTSGANAATHGAVVNGDYVGRILFSASNGSSYLTNGTDIVGYAAGNQTTTNNGGGIFFRTVPQNSVAQSVERMRIDDAGRVGIGTSSPTAQLHTTGSVLLAGAGTPGAGKVLTSDASGNATWQNAVGSTTVSNKTADFTLTASDNAGFILVNSASLIRVTVPATLAVGFYCQIIQQGAGQVQVIGSGVTMNSALGFFTRAQGSSIGIMMATGTIGFVSGDTGL